MNVHGEGSVVLAIQSKPLFDIIELTLTSETRLLKQPFPTMSQLVLKAA